MLAGQRKQFGPVLTEELKELGHYGLGSTFSHTLAITAVLHVASLAVQTRTHI